MAHLTDAQVKAFWDTGCITLENAVTPQQLADMRSDFESWVEESRSHDAPYGEMLDGRPRFDVDPDHSAEHPSLRRVASPTELSDAYLGVVTSSAMTDMVAELIGPDIRFHHSKINSKLPHTSTMVKWHQDFTFDPHSNDDLVTALLFLDEVTQENGPLMVAPGSHKGPLLSLCQNGVFTGAVSEAHARDFEAQGRKCRPGRPVQSASCIRGSPMRPPETGRRGRARSS